MRTAAPLHGPARGPVRAGRYPAWAAAAAGLLVSVAVAGALWVSCHLEVDPVLHDVALFGHLASLVVGFGAVLAVDWVALLWLLRQRTLADVLVTAGNAHLPIWAGYAGLVLTGMFLGPDLSSWLTWTKLALVVLIGWNGVVAMSLMTPLSRIVEPATMSRPHLASAASAALSQAGWWGAMAIGFLNGR